MDPKELKALLKEAKEGIKSKNYDVAVKNCKQILKKIPTHYQAYLFLGTACKEQAKWAQALEYFKKAVELDPNQIYAWQGIILTYERQGSKADKDLLDAYARVAGFHEKDDDKSRYIESTKKLAHALVSQDDKKGALKVITRLGKSHGLDLEMAGMVELLLTGTRYDTRTPEQNELYSRALDTIVNQSPKPSDDTCKKLFTQLNRQGSYDKVVEQALGMREKWNFYLSPMEWLCRYYMEERLEPSVIQEIGGFGTVTDKLFKLHPSSSYGHFARGKFLIEEGLRVMEGFSFIRTGLESNSNYHAVKTLVRGRLDYGDFENAAEDCTNWIRQFEKDPAACRVLRLFCAEAWVWLNPDKGEELLENIKDDVKEELYTEWVVLKCKLGVRRMNFDQVKAALKLADDKELSHWYFGFCRSFVSADKDGSTLKDAIATHVSSVQHDGETEHATCQMMLEGAILLHDLKYYKESGDLLVALTQTAIGKLRPLSWKYLGLLYSLQDDIELASKCYRKAYDLCPCGDVGSLLSDSYFVLEKDQENRELLVGATKTFVKLKSKWAWLRLGVLLLHSGEANEAVTALQAAIRADINDCHVWESLADAYFLRGSYSAALNSYNRALSLGADPMYSKLKIGVVYQCLGHHDKSIETLQSLLEEYPNDCTPVLVELARTNSLIAQETIAENFDIRGLQAVEKSIAYAVLAVLKSSKRILLPWQIIAESALTLSSLTEDTCVKVPTFLLGEDPHLLNASDIQSIENFEYKIITKEELREIGIQAILQCVQVVEKSPKNGALFSPQLKAYLYHQLALLYFRRSRHASTKGEAESSADFLKKSLISAKKAVAFSQTHYVLWNSLGIIAYYGGNDQLAQHAFIKSLEAEGNNVVAWCNLGVLYMKHNEPFLAHQIFKKAQSVSPLHSMSWIGQGLCAEILEPTEAQDLFRHAAYLEPSVFGISCYTDYVCRVLLKDLSLSSEDYWFAITRVDALIIVNDLLTKIEARQRTPLLYNMKGIAAALNGFYKTALEAFSTALKVSESCPTLALTAAEYQQVYLNKIVVLVKMEQYEDAVEAFSSVETMDKVCLQVGALTMSKLGHHEQAVNLYQELLTKLEEGSDEKIDATIALGLVYNIHRGVDAACELLLEDFMVKSPYGLLALSAIGVLNGDDNFLKEIILHLVSFEDDPRVIADIGLMKACFHIMNGDSKKGVRELLKLVHIHPLQPKLWSILSCILFRHEFESVHSTTFRKITMTALKLSSTQSKVLNPLASSMSPSIVPLCYLMNNDWKRAIVVALAGIKNYPTERENWIVLACAYWFQFAETRDPSVYEKVVYLLEKELTINSLTKRAGAWAQSFLQLVQNYRIS